MNYMKEHLLKAGANMTIREGDELSRIPSLKTWFRTSRAVVLYLTNGTLQVNNGHMHLFPRSQNFSNIDDSSEQSFSDFENPSDSD
jgi:hypothetical protein